MLTTYINKPIILTYITGLGLDQPPCMALRVPATPTESGTATPTEDALLVPPQVGHRGSTVGHHGR